VGGRVRNGQLEVARLTTPIHYTTMSSALRSMTLCCARAAMFVPVAAMFVGSAPSSELSYAHLLQGDNVDSGSVNRGSALGVDTLNCHNVSLAADGMLQSWLEPQDMSMHRAVTAAVRIEPHSPLSHSPVQMSTFEHADNSICKFILRIKILHSI
jgi:hypothetical protein